MRNPLSELWRVAGLGPWWAAVVGRLEAAGAGEHRGCVARMGGCVPQGPRCPSVHGWVSLPVPSLRLLERLRQDPAAPSHPRAWLGARSTHPDCHPSCPRPARAPRGSDAVLRVHGAEVVRRSQRAGDSRRRLRRGTPLPPGILALRSARSPASGSLSRRGTVFGKAQVVSLTPCPPLPLQPAAGGLHGAGERQ